ncbi:restriction endonuclease [Paenibacillus sp. FSL L8-0493]|uniref:nSTAND3 domain-containing NTPase n=1 Tax=unclassified Paenibacillus TaxID=185978 RepID=UPI0030F99783
MYDFKTLDYNDFERLVKDILSKMYNVHIERFKSGRDGGVDLRHSHFTDDETIIQCKHYANSSYSNLKSVLRREEAPKVRTLSPKRYILVTSLPLNDTEKTEIINIFDPYIKSKADILGSEDLNDELSKYGEIEARHYKLWLHNFSLITELLSREIHNQTEMTLRRISKRIIYYVEPPNFNRILQFLEDQHFVVITGNPGVGKSTIAEILLSYCVKKGSVPYVVKDISQILELYIHGENQVFLCDDFLGQTKLKSHHDDDRLLQFIKDISDSEKKTRLILVSRENIIQSAKLESEYMKSKYFELSKHLVKVEDFKLEDKANILYAYLKNSNIPNPFIEYIVKNKKYMNIIQHRNFLPRIIEEMTDMDIIKMGVIDDPNQFYNEFIQTLNNPFSIWDSLYMNATQRSKDLLLTLAMFEGSCSLEGLEIAFSSYHYYKCSQNNEIITDNSLRSALEEVDNSFIRIEDSGEVVKVRFNNPSVKDFIEYVINQRLDSRNILFLIQSMVYFEQVDYLYELISRRDNPTFTSEYTKAIIRVLSDYRYEHYVHPFYEEYGVKGFIRKSEDAICTLLDLNSESFNLEEVISTLLIIVIKFISEEANYYEYDELIGLLVRFSDCLDESAFSRPKVKEVLERIFAEPSKEHRGLFFYYYFACYCTFAPINKVDVEIKRIKEEFSISYKDLFENEGLENTVPNGWGNRKFKEWLDILEFLVEFYGVNFDEELEGVNFALDEEEIRHREYLENRDYDDDLFEDEKKRTNYTELEIHEKFSTLVNADDLSL